LEKWEQGWRKEADAAVDGDEGSSRRRPACGGHGQGRGHATVPAPDKQGLS